MPPIVEELTWANVDLDDPKERARFYEQERQKGGERARAAFQRLRDLGIMDEHGEIIPKELPVDMQSGAKRDFGG
jgi:hypothetical protein